MILSNYKIKTTLPFSTLTVQRLSTLLLGRCWTAFKRFQRSRMGHLLPWFPTRARTLCWCVVGLVEGRGLALHGWTTDGKKQTLNYERICCYLHVVRWWVACDWRVDSG